LVNGKAVFPDRCIHSILFPREDGVLELLQVYVHNLSLPIYQAPRSNFPSPLRKEAGHAAILFVQKIVNRPIPHSSRVLSKNSIHSADIE
jgi:hypothetical protein